LLLPSIFPDRYHRRHREGIPAHSKPAINIHLSL
jgi:hypothetical protein